MKRRHEQGVALIIVLAMLMLLSALLVAFMSSATTELSASQAASAGSTSRQIADSTVNLVIGQMREATTSTDEATTWSSQPGAIRTYSGRIGDKRPLRSPHTGATATGYSAGNNDYVFKLYSADNLKVKSDVYDNRDLPIETGVIENWSTEKPLEYVDLNEPIVMPRFDLDPSGKTVAPSYPIIDPRAMFNRNGTAATSTSNPALVEGFDAKLSTDSDLILADGKEKLPYLPMPVKWLYVLKDGTVGAPDLATKDNPIVGRTAFWVDDESCKLNINTSSEGTYWDTPSVSTDQESGDVVTGSGVLIRPSTNPYSLSLAAASPPNGEFQRYGGHPYTTCLSPVLGGLWNLSPSMSLYPMVGAATNPYRDFKEAIYKITPFTPYGPMTTIGATRNADPDMPTNGSRPKQNVMTKHLYASVDELMFKSQRNTGGTNPKSELNNFSTYFTPEALEKTRFFLTANSRAPELNLFGRPRVTLWPVNSDYRNRTTFDDLFAFTSTIAKTASEDQDKKYYLSRHNAQDDKADFDQQNQDMYEYLQYLTGQPTPGYGGSIAARYNDAGGTRNQILTEIFDYVRAINLVDTGEASRLGNEFVPYTPRFYPEGTNNTYSRGYRSIDWSGQVTPLKVGKTMGMGRFLVISEAALIFHKVSSGGTTALQATLALETATTMPGYPAIRDTYWTKITSDPTKKLQIQLKTSNAYSPLTDVQFCTYTGGTINIANVAAHDVTQGRGFMPTLGFTSTMHYYTQPHRGPTNPNYVLGGRPMPERDPNFTQTGGTNPQPKNFIWNNPANLGTANFNLATTGTNYPYVSQPLPIPPNTTNFKFQGPLLQVEIWSGQGPSDNRSRLVQTVNLNFPDVTVDLPIPTTGDMKSRFDGSLDGRANPITTGDVVRSIEFAGPPGLPVAQRGDLRIAAVLQNIPPTYYLPRDAGATANSGPYFSTTALVHGLQRSHGDPETGHTGGGKLVAGGNNRGSKPPILPAIINGVQRSDTAPGDWDRGISKHMDGAFGNKVDEGNLKFDYAASGSSRLPYFRGRGIEETGQSFFTPNRQLPSPVMLGSLPTGIDPDKPDQSKPWQTLLFRPDRDSRPHPGSGGTGKVPEHVWLDLFHVPVVEPYAISEPFSTAGKVNMNYVIAPFGYAKGESGNNPFTQSPRSYLRRDSALRGVLRSTWMLLVPSTETEMGHQEAVATARNLRWPIDLDKTIDEMEIQLNDQSQGVGSRSTNLFRSASQICDIDLYPKATAGVSGTPTVTNWSTFWNTYGGTGDNQRERPYAYIYPRLTTKSNVYTIHMRCQVIRKAPSSAPNVFDPVRDQVVSEYRGSSMIERFIDPNDENLLKYNHRNEKVDPYYRFRVVGTKQFTAN